MPYRVLVPRRVQKQLDALPRTAFDRIDGRIVSLREDPRPSGAKKLQGSTNAYRLRVGDYRIV